jgi:hypothetical protein
MNELSNKIANISKVVDVIREMLVIDPVKRCTASKALEQFHEIPNDWSF